MKSKNLCCLILIEFMMVTFTVLPAATHNPGSVMKSPMQGNAIKLPGVIKIKSDDVVPTQSRKPIKTEPFTVAELKAVAGKHVVMNGATPTVWIKNKPISLAQYAEELNKWESFLNTLGYTLRDGPLAAQGLIKNPVRRTTTDASSDFGAILRLKPRTPNTTKNPQMYQAPGINQQFIYQDPYKYAVFNPNVVINPGEAGAVNTQAVAPRSRKTGSNVVGPRPNRLASANMRVRRLRLPSGPAISGPRFLDPVMPCGPTQLTGCPCTPGTPNCPNGVLIAPDGSVVTDCGTALNPVGGGSSPPPSAKTVTVEGTACGEKTPGDPPCLYDPKGSMHAKWAGISSCTNASGGNGWFNADACGEMTFTGDEAGTDMTLNNAGQMHFDVGIFGAGFDLLDANAQAQYDGQHTSMAKVTVPLTGQELSPEGFNADYETPPVFIPVGPIDVKITGGGKASLGFDQFDSPFAQPPTDCSGGTGQLGLNLGLHAYADLHLTAAVDVLIVEAGIEGVLILADDHFGLGMSDLIDPGKNAITVTPNFNYALKHLAGKIYLFVSVDLLVYTKKFEVQIFDYPGLQSSDNKTLPSKTFSSKHS